MRRNNSEENLFSSCLLETFSEAEFFGRKRDARRLLGFPLVITRGEDHSMEASLADIMW